MGLGLDHAHAIGDAEVPHQALQLVIRQLASRAARATDHHQPARFGLRTERSEDTHRDVGPLERLDATDKEEERTGVGQAERSTGLGVVPRSEIGVVDTERHDAHTIGRRAVERGDLVGFHAARREHRVRTSDDLGFGLGSPMREIGLDLFWTGLGLHPIERVERTDERKVQLMLDDVAGEPRQPVVGVDGLERAALIL